MDLQTEFARNPEGLLPKRARLIIVSVVGGLGLAITSICVPFMVPALRSGEGAVLCRLNALISGVCVCPMSPPQPPRCSM